MTLSAVITPEPEEFVVFAAKEEEGCVVLMAPRDACSVIYIKK